MIYFIYLTLGTGEEVRTDICYTMKEARKIMQSYKRKRLSSKALEIDNSSEEKAHQSIIAPIYYTI
jgi:hypothetical protein